MDNNGGGSVAMHALGFIWKDVAHCQVVVQITVGCSVFPDDIDSNGNGVSKLVRDRKSDAVAIFASDNDCTIGYDTRICHISSSFITDASDFRVH